MNVREAELSHRALLLDHLSLSEHRHKSSNACLHKPQDPENTAEGELPCPLPRRTYFFFIDQLFQSVFHKEDLPFNENPHFTTNTDNSFFSYSRES